jgi:alkylation response protein AidB-like acyl-CoA dehydrogenase
MPSHAAQTDTARDAARTFAELADSGALDLPVPGSGRTGERFEVLAGWGRQDPVLARLAEGHADARAILAELSLTGYEDTPRGQRWGVWAAVPTSVTARRIGTGWLLDGDRPWCSGAAVCTHALVTAGAPDGPRLFAVEVRGPGMAPLEGTWPAVGMSASDSRTVRFTAVPAEPIGEPDAYVRRPGFWHGSAGVAACWYGVADTLLRASQARALDPHAVAHLGSVDADLAAAGALLRETAAAIDAKPADCDPVPARRLRAVVEACATSVMSHVGRALGAGPLCMDAGHAARVADLTVYLRQSHAERDLEMLGAVIAGQEESPW